MKPKDPLKNSVVGTKFSKLERKRRKPTKAYQMKIRRGGLSRLEPSFENCSHEGVFQRVHQPLPLERYFKSPAWLARWHASLMNHPWRRGALLAVVLVVCGAGTVYAAWKGWQPAPLAESLPRTVLAYTEFLHPSGTPPLKGQVRLDANITFNVYEIENILTSEDPVRHGLRFENAPADFLTNAPSLATHPLYLKLRPALPLRAQTFDFGFGAPPSDLLPPLENLKPWWDAFASTRVEGFARADDRLMIAVLKQDGQPVFAPRLKYKGELLEHLPMEFKTLHAGQDLASLATVFAPDSPYATTFFEGEYAAIDFENPEDRALLVAGSSDTPPPAALLSIFPVSEWKDNVWILASTEAAKDRLIFATENVGTRYVETADYVKIKPLTLGSDHVKVTPSESATGSRFFDDGIWVHTVSLHLL